MKSRLEILPEIAAWAWTVLAGGGGLWLLFTAGPWPPTNGWFALASAIVACPLTAWTFQRYTAIRISGWLRFGGALFFYIAGRVALQIWPHH